MADAQLVGDVGSQGGAGGAEPGDQADQPEADDWAPPPIMPRDIYGGTDEDYRIYLESMRR